MASPCCSRMPVAQPDVSALPAAPGLRKRRARVAGGPPLRASRGQARGRWTAGSTRPSRRVPTLARRPGGDRADRARSRANGARPGSSSPDLPRMRRWRLDRLVAAVVARDLGGPPPVRPAQHPLRDRLHQHAGLEHPQPVPRLPGAARRPHGALGLQARAVPRRAQPAGRRAALRRLVLLLASPARRPTPAPPPSPARWRSSCARMPAPTGGSRSTRSCSPGFRALAAGGLAVEDGEPVTERARAIKGPDEIRAMRCALHACETAMAAMRAAARPGLSEDEIWAVLHAENIRRGGEWIETRLLTSGPRTNPWFQECGPRIVQPNEIVAFDTDLIGPYGYCADISRTWWIGDGTPRADMRADHAPRLASRSPGTPPCSRPAPASPSCTTTPSSCPSRTVRSATPASGTGSGSATSGPTSFIRRIGWPGASRECSSPAWCSASRAWSAGPAATSRSSSRSRCWSPRIGPGDAVALPGRPGPRRRPLSLKRRGLSRTPKGTKRTRGRGSWQPD